MLNRAAELGIGTEDPRFPVVKLEKWVHPEFVHGIASGAPVPLKGAAVLRVTLLEGKTPEEARAGPEIFVRCKIAARGSSDWHGLILGGRALDCASRMGLGFRPGPEHHILDTLSIRIPRCEDYTRVRKDRAYAFEARLSSLDGAGCSEPGGTDRELLRYSGAEPLELAPGDGVLVPVEREVQSSADGSLTEAVFPVDCGVEAVPGLWTTAEGFVLLAAQELDYTLEPGDVVAEVRSGLVETAACDCGAVETTFLSPGEDVGLRSRTCLATSLAPALAALSGQGALPALGSQRLLAQLLVVGERARVALRAVAVVAEVEADLASCSLSATLGAGTGRQGAVLGGRARRPGRGRLAAALSSRISFCALAKAADGSEGSPAVVECVEWALLVLKDHLVGLFPRGRGPEAPPWHPPARSACPGGSPSASAEASCEG